MCLCSKRLENDTGCWSSWQLRLFLAQPTIILQFIVWAARCKTVNEKDPAGIFSASKTHKTSLDSVSTQSFPMTIPFTTVEILFSLFHSWLGNFIFIFSCYSRPILNSLIDRMPSTFLNSHTTSLKALLHFWLTLFMFIICICRP
jgi:hypothetical protein